MNVVRVAGIAACALMLARSAEAQEPNINPGMWETTSTVTIQSEQFPIPPRTDSSRDCVTAEDIAQGRAFLEDNEDCEFTRKEMRSGGMEYAIICASPDGASVSMTASITFSGDTMRGIIDGDVESPMGFMQMRVEMSGERIGDC